MTIFHYNLMYWCTVGNRTPTNMKICTNEVKHGEGLVTRQSQNWDADSSPLTLRITEHSSVSNKGHAYVQTRQGNGCKVNPATTPTLHLNLSDCTRKRREEGVPDIPGARAQTIAVQLPCALLASGACTLLVATHHIPNPQKPLTWGVIFHWGNRNTQTTVEGIIPGHPVNQTLFSSSLMVWTQTHSGRRCTVLESQLWM